MLPIRKDYREKADSIRFVIEKVKYPDSYDPEVNLKVFRLFRRGLRYSEIARILGVSRQNIRRMILMNAKYIEEI